MAHHSKAYYAKKREQAAEAERRKNQFLRLEFASVDPIRKVGVSYSTYHALEDVNTSDGALVKPRVRQSVTYAKLRLGI